MTAVQDWLSIRSIDPRFLKTLICDVIRRPAAEEPAPAEEPPLLRRGVERC